MGKLIDLTGQKFNSLTVLKRGENTPAGQARWICQCDCENITLVAGAELRSGRTKSCGCQKGKANAASLEGKRFGRLVVIDRNLANNKYSKAWWNCVCDCGNTSCVPTSALNSGNTTSCGMCVGQISIGEENIVTLLRENNIEFIRQYGFSDLPKKKYDFAIMDGEKVVRLIEFDGRQHYSPNRTNWYSEDVVRRDAEKNAYSIKNNIPLVRIRYEYRDKMTIDMLLGDKFLIKKGE